MINFDYDRIWKETWGDMQRFGPVHRHHRRIYFELLRNLPKQEIQSIADIGCGEGSNLFFLQSIFTKAKLYGFDVSKTALEAARLNIVGDFELLDIQKDVLLKKFDLVFCSDVVEHLEDDETALRNIWQITGGYALIATVQGYMRANEKHIGHVRNYGYGELRQKMEKAGFRITQVIEWGYPFYSPLFRNIVGLFPVTENFSYGKYGVFKKLVSNVLYYIFLLNRSDKGDVIIILAKP